MVFKHLHDFGIKHVRKNELISLGPDRCIGYGVVTGNTPDIAESLVTLLF